MKADRMQAILMLIGMVVSAFVASLVIGMDLKGELTTIKINGEHTAAAVVELKSNVKEKQAADDERLHRMELKVDNIQANAKLTVKEVGKIKKMNQAAAIAGPVHRWSEGSAN